MADQMYRCEWKRRFIVNGNNEWRWVERAVDGLESGRDPDIRCMHCHGAVRVHVQQVPEGPADHVEHLRREDSENCVGGSYFKGEHRTSQFPIE
jgi:hypothetical protein